MERTKCIDVFDKHGALVWHRSFEPNLFEKLQRLLELLPDEESFVILDKVIADLQAPKLDLAKKLSKKLTANGKMSSFLEEALTALPMKQLQGMEKQIDKLKMKREPGGDCLVIEDGKQSHRLHL